MKPLWASRSLSAKLIRMNLMVSATALVLATMSLLLYDAISFKQNLLHSLRTEAQIIGANSVSALLFDDHDAARETLSALRNSPDVVAATIAAPDGSRFANFERQNVSVLENLPPVIAGVNEQQWKRGSRILLGSRINFQGKSVGTVYILAQTTEVAQRVRRYMLIALMVLLVCLGLALLLTASLRRVLAEPIVGLAVIAQTVTREKDYSYRAPLPETDDEVAVLVRSFNEMLGQIQARDRALSASRDVLEQRVAERTAELQAANKELEAFSYSVAHDLRGPLDTMGNASFMLSHADISSMDEQSREILQMLPRMTHRMSALIDDLLNLSRSKSAPLHLEPVDLRAIAIAICDDLSKAEPDRKVEFTVAERAYGLADQGLMRVVLYNLMGNAWKYSSKVEHARAEFGVIMEGDRQTYFVRDNGAGFDPSLQDRLFKPFERLHAQSDFIGTGIGLATVQRIIARHGGRVWAEAAINKGATFYFTLGDQGSHQEANAQTPNPTDGVGFGRTEGS